MSYEERGVIRGRGSVMREGWRHMRGGVVSYEGRGGVI